MAEIAQQYQDKLKSLKKMVEDWHDYFKDNNDRYHEFMRFVFDTSLTNDDMAKLQAIQKPAIEFNVLEAYISRLRGEFAEQEPSLMVRIADGVPADTITEELLETVDVIEGHIREILSNVKNDSFEYCTYSDCLAGGFSVAEVYTDYINEMSFEQNICIERAFDPTLCGFDPLARESHKGDGKYCFKIVPKTKEEFQEDYGEKAIEGIKFTRSENIGHFNWSYKNQNQEILLIATIFVKEGQREKIVKLSNGKVILKKHYEELEQIIHGEGIMVQTPKVIEERWSMIEKIVRYDLCETKVLARYVTDFKYLPLVFIDGNSVVIRENDSGPAFQMTRPYVYHARGIQQLKNFAGQTVANEMETMVQHKWIACIESIPEKYKDAYKNPQQAQVLLYNAYYDEDPDKPNPPPREVQRTPTPPLVEAVFMGADQVTQSILGSYDAQLGLTNGDTSGRAIQQGALHSNAAAMPYLMSYYKGLNRLGTIFLDLIPKYYVTPRSLPIKKQNGLRDMQVINKPFEVPTDEVDEMGVQIKKKKIISSKYDPNSLQIKIEAGVSTALQKQIALEQIIRLMGASELFAQFINSEGLEALLDNIDIRGVDELKVKAMQFMQGVKQAQQAAAQQPDQLQQTLQAQVMIEQGKTEQRREQALLEHATDTAKVAIDKQKADIDMLETLHKIEGGSQEAMIDAEILDGEQARESVRLALDISKHHHEKEMAEAAMQQPEPST